MDSQSSTVQQFSEDTEANDNGAAILHLSLFGPRVWRIPTAYLDCDVLISPLGSSHVLSLSRGYKMFIKKMANTEGCGIVSKRHL